MPISGQTGYAATRKSKLTPRTVLALALVALVVVFAAVNSQTVTIHWIVTTTQTPMIVVIVGCGLVGFVVGWLLSRRAMKRKAR